MTSRVENAFLTGVSYAYRNLAGGGDAAEGDDHGGDHGDGHSAFGVHILPEDLYKAVVFFVVIWAAGTLCQRVLKMPSLVGEIFAGILLGPPVADFVPNPEAFVLLGEIGLILLVIEAGVDIDLTTLKLIGARGIIIAIIGSILPIAIGIGIAFGLGVDVKGAIAAGAAFGPTSLGIAMNILRAGKIVNTPVGQLIVSAAVIDDMIALIILTQLEALTGTFSVTGVVVPIVSSIAILVLGGYIAIKILPIIINRYMLVWFPEEHHSKLSLLLLFLLLIALIPLCRAAQASHLMGAFIAGLSFCADEGVHHLFSEQWKRILHWLMRVFFAASIGFQVPIKDFGKGQVIWKGIVFTLALTGKLAVGLLVPNFNQTKRFTGNHLRDVFLTGLSMAAEGEFAFVIAVFGVDNGLISKDIYASIVLAVLISTIIPPFLLRYTITRFNKKAEALLKKTVQDEMKKKIEVDDGGADEDELRKGIKDMTTLFICIQMQCQSRWGLLPSIMADMKRMNLDVIDHRSWHPRGVDSTLVNEIYAKGSIGNDTVDAFLKSVEETLLTHVGQSDAKVKVTRWHPGVEAEIVEEIDDDVGHKEVRQKISVSDNILKEAQQLLEKKQKAQLAATQERTVEEILEAAISVPGAGSGSGAGAGDGDDNNEKPVMRRRTRRVRTMSTPVVGGDMFAGRTSSFNAHSAKIASSIRVPDLPSFDALTSTSSSKGLSAQLKVSGETFQIHISPTTLAKVRKGQSLNLNPRSIRSRGAEPDMEFQLDGYVRKPFMPANLPTVAEDQE